MNVSASMHDKQDHLQSTE